MSDPYGLGLTPEMFLGEPTIHVPINMIVQDMGDGRVIGVWQTSMGEALKFKSEMTHQLIFGDAFIRPQLVCQSNQFRGSGMAHLLRNAFVEPEQWEPLFKRT